MNTHSLSRRVSPADFRAKAPIAGAALAMLATALLGPARAQPAPLHHAVVAPSGCQIGRTQEIALSGQGMKDVAGWVFLDPGLSASRLADGRWSITAAETLAPRDRDVRLLLPGGLSTPRRFTVSPWPQAVEQEKNDSPATAQVVAAPVSIHGRIEPGVDVDWFSFAVERNEHVVVCCRSLTIDGLVEPALAVIDPHGSEIAHDAGGARDGWLHFTAAQSGTFQLKLEERAYRQPKANFYALSIHKGPWLAAAFPNVLRRGATQEVTLYGYRLPGGVQVEQADMPGLEQLAATIAAPTVGDADGGGWTPAAAVMLDAFEYRHPGVAGRIRFQLADDEVATETDRPNETIDQAQPLTPPVEVAGRFLAPRDVDWYRFSARKGEAFWIEAVGQRAGPRMDIDVALHDAQGKLLATLGDQPQPKDAPADLPLAALDAGGPWKAPADGEYRLAVRDLYGSVVGGVDRCYRLSIGPPREAARVVATTGSLTVKTGASAVLPLAAVRRGGHQAPIRIWVENLPAGLAADEFVLPADKTGGKLHIKLTAAADAPAWTGRIELAAETELAGQMTRIPVRAVTLIADGPPRRVRLCDGVVVAVHK